MLAKGLAHRPGLRPSALIHVALGRAVVDLEPGRVAVAGRRVAVTDQRDMPALGERGPGFIGRGGRHRRGHQRDGQSNEGEPAHAPRLLGTVS